ncbi:MAG: GNAT family N-acetyltransferase, partial [Myxococcota bacterium]
MITLRDVRPEDAQGLLDLERAIVTDGRGVVRTLKDLEGEPTEITEDPRCVRVVAVEGEEIVGEGSVHRPAPSLVAHVGQLAIGVHPKAQRKGVGRRLLKHLVDRAAELGVIRLELQMRADNDRARALYESEGFVLEGVRRRFLRTEEGAFVDDLTLVR